MAASRAQLVVGGLLISGAMAYIGVAGLRTNWVYYQEVDAFVRQGHGAGERVRVVGTLGPTGAEIRPAELLARFRLLGAQEGLEVEYRGAIPEMLSPGGQVVVEGALDEKGVFRAHTLLTKCASKYEAGTGARGPAPRPAP